MEESFLDLKSNSFNLEASRLRDEFVLSQLCGVIALTTLFLVLQGTQVVIEGKRRLVDAHWNRGMSYLKVRLELGSSCPDSPVANPDLFLFLTPNLHWLLSGNRKILLSVKSPSSVPFQLLSFVSQAGQ